MNLAEQLSHYALSLRYSDLRRFARDTPVNAARGR